MKVLFKIQIDTDADQQTRSTFLNLCGKKEKQLTLEMENEQVLFALPMFAITNYMEFKDEFYPAMNDEDKKEYNEMFVTEKGIKKTDKDAKARIRQ